MTQYVCTKSSKSLRVTLKSSNSKKGNFYLVYQFFRGIPEISKIKDELKYQAPCLSVTLCALFMLHCA